MVRTPWAALERDLGKLWDDSSERAGHMAKLMEAMAKLRLEQAP